MSIPESRNIRPDATLLLGPTGVGKTPLAAVLSEQGLSGHKVHHFDFGEELRRVANGAPGTCTKEEVVFVRRVLDDGVLLEDQHFGLAANIFRSFLLRSGYQYPEQVILNGLPRHLGQARDMESITRIIRLVVLQCEASDVFERIRNNTGGDRMGRSDDSIQMIKRKLEIFSARTEPLVAHYERSGIPVIRLKVDPYASPEQVYVRLSARITDPGYGNKAYSAPTTSTELT